MGIILSLVQQSFPPKPTWSANDIPDLSGKVVIVTGGNTGLGFETTKVCPGHFLRIHSNSDIRYNQSLLQHNAKVYIGARSQGKAEEAIKNLKELTGKEALFLKLDLGDLKAVKAAAEEFTRYDLSVHLLNHTLNFWYSKEKELHILYNNGCANISGTDMNWSSNNITSEA
jgi:retinol dehydrogenase 12